MVARIARQNEPAPTPERELLAQAARHHHDLIGQDKALTKALAGIETDLADVRRQLAQAEQRVAEAEQSAVTNRIASAMGGEPEPPGTTLAEARAALPVLQDQLAELNRAKDHFLLQTGPVAQRLVWSLTAVKEAVRKVVQTDPATAALVGREEITRREHCSLKGALEFLAMRGMLPERPVLAAVPETSDLEHRFRAAVAQLEAGHIKTVLPWVNSKGALNGQNES
jgi:hypothetical protein